MKEYDLLTPDIVEDPERTKKGEYHKVGESVSVRYTANSKLVLQPCIIGGFEAYDIRIWLRMRKRTTTRVPAHMAGWVPTKKGVILRDRTQAKILGEAVLKYSDQLPDHIQRVHRIVEGLSNPHPSRIRYYEGIELPKCSSDLKSPASHLLES